MEFLSIFLFALAVSCDGLFAGVAYGMKKIRIPVLSLIVIAVASALAVSLSMLCGKGLTLVMPQHFASNLGAILIMIIGLYFLLMACREKIESLEDIGEEPLLSLKIKPMGIIIQILKEPASADFDSSGEISTGEAFFLGLALAMDALGAGIGMAMAGFNIFFTALSVGVLKFILVSTGIAFGSKMQCKHLQSISALIPGLILVAIGICEII